MSGEPAERQEGRRLLQARLATQWLEPPAGPLPVPVVSHLCAVQAQDERWTPWTVGLRAAGCDHAQVLAALAEGSLVRTWLLRGTLHLVVSADLAWLRALVAPRVLRGNARRYRQLELDERTLERGAGRLESALHDGPLSRSELAARLDDDGLAPTGQRLPYLLQFAALTGRLVCWPATGREQMYARAPAHTPAEAPPSRIEALTRLAQRYVAGHGPATAEDFAWWSGFPMQDARRALDAVPGAHAVRLAGRNLVSLDAVPAPGARTSAHLLPPFDEYLLGYRDRSPMLRARDASRFKRGGGMPHRALLLNGAIAGIWTVTGSDRRRRLEVSAFPSLEGGEEDLVMGAARTLDAFYGGFPMSPAIVVG